MPNRLGDQNGTTGDISLRQKIFLDTIGKTEAEINDLADKKYDFKDPREIDAFRHIYAAGVSAKRYGTLLKISNWRRVIYFLLKTSED